jgi:hypothetical protein
MTFWRFIILLSFLGVGYYFVKEEPVIIQAKTRIKNILKFSEIKYKSGVLIKRSPIQKTLRENKFKYHEYDLIPHASIAMRARVLGTERYWFDEKSEIAPYDLILGWKEMSDQKILDKIEFSQGLRFYQYDYDGTGFRVKTMSNNSANMHLIPADEYIKNVISSVKEGDIIAIKGVLVDVKSPKGWVWKTSRKRSDIGEGSNEILYVKDISIITGNYPRVQ